MRCRFNHSHPPWPLKAATGNPTQPRGPRPYHCPECSEVTNLRAVGRNWVEYSDAVAARDAGHPQPCRRCFPTATLERAVSSQRGPGVGRGRGVQESPSVTADDLASWRRQILRFLDMLDGRAAHGEGLVARITRLKRERRIPRDTAAQMLLVTEARNVAEYENRRPTSAGGQAVRNAWAAIVEWANGRGFNVETP